VCTTVILSEAKDLMPVANGDEVLRFAQDDGEKIAHDADPLLESRQAYATTLLRSVKRKVSSASRIILAYRHRGRGRA
jgi:hypothetical protein